MKSVLQQLVDVCEEVMEYLDDGDCPFCDENSIENGHDETCPAVRIQAALGRARGDE